MEQQCRIAEVSRAGFYRYLQQTEPEQADMLLRARLQELAVEHHRLRGYRLLTKTLQREGQVVNPNRLRSLVFSKFPRPGRSGRQVTENPVSRQVDDALACYR